MASVSCLGCGTEFSVPGRKIYAKARKYCRVCKNPPSAGRCRGCGSDLPPCKSKNRRKWCSDSCRVRAFYSDPEKREQQRAAAKERTRSRRVHKACLSCGDPKLNNKGDFCSSKPECRRASVLAHRMGRTACVADGCERPSQGRGLCSTHYQQWWRAQVKNEDAYRTRRSRENAARKLAVAAATVEKVSPIRVFELDGWCCHLCGKKINRRLKHPNPLSASIDHVVPLSKGGTHCYENCRAAHLGCNSAKSNRGGGEQMLLAVS